MNYAIVLKSSYDLLSDTLKLSFFRSVCESIDTCRFSNDRLFFIVKWKSETDPCGAYNLEHTNYTYDEIIIELAKANWVSTDI